MTIPSCFSRFVEEDIVVLARPAPSNAAGPAGTEFEDYIWGARWTPEMDEFVGKQFKIIKTVFSSSDKHISIVCEPMFDCTISSRWYLAPWSLALPGEVGSTTRLLEKSELDLVNKFVTYQADEKKKKILAGLSEREASLMDLATSISVELSRAQTAYWKTKTGKVTADTNRIMLDQCKKLEELTSGSNSTTMKDRVALVRQAIEVSLGSMKSVEREIRTEVLSVLNRFVNSDIYQSKVPDSKMEDVVIRVVTDPIVLEFKDNSTAGGSKVFKEDFGPMEIHFSMVAQTVKVIAQKPNYDEHTSSRFFHPHVNSSGNVCEGAGRGPISNAIKDGRFTDLFDLVIGILENYNPESPYCHLRNWHPPKSKCANCGELSLESNLSRCGKCRALLCRSCVRHCNSCEGKRCPTCMTKCGICGGSYCDNTSCKETHPICPDCGKMICKSSQRSVVFGGIRVHQDCCISLAGSWVRKIDAFLCPDCGAWHKKVNGFGCVACDKLVCKVCFEHSHGCCKECDEKIRQEEIEAFRLADERHAGTEGVPAAGEIRTATEESSSAVEEATSEGTETVGDGVVRDESETEEQGEANVSA